MEITETLHIIRAHLLHYSSLLGALKAAVKFIMESPNPALTRDQKKVSEHLLERECKIQLGEIDRIEKQRQVEESRVKNVMDLVSLVFHSLVIPYSRVFKGVFRC